MSVQEAFQLFVMEAARQIVPVIVNLLVVIVIIPLVMRLRKYVDERIDEKTRQRISAQIQILVRAAEQSGIKDAVLKDGAAKKKYVIERMQAWLTTNGLTYISAGEVSDMVEAAVFHELNSYIKAVEIIPPPPPLPAVTAPTPTPVAA